MFELDAAAPLWLVKQSGNVAVAPRGGKFAGPLVTPGTTYDVRGKGTGKQRNPPAAVPFGGKGLHTHHFLHHIPAPINE